MTQIVLILFGVAFLIFLGVSLIARIRHKQAKKLDRMYRSQAGIEGGSGGSNGGYADDIGGGFDGGGD